MTTPPRPPLTKAVFEAAVAAVDALLEGAGPADARLSAYFRQHRALGAHDRAFIADLFYTLLRRRRFLAHLAPDASSRQLVLACLVRLNGLALRTVEPWLRKPEIEWLRALKARPADDLPPAVQAELPDWLWDRMAAQYGAEQALMLARSLQQPAPLDLRVNRLKGQRDAVLAQFAQEGIAARATPYAPDGVRLEDKLALNRHVLFETGVIEVQDEGSQLLAPLVAPRRGEMVADFCAGAGGKTLALGALMANTGRLYAFDVSERRLANLKPRLARSGLSNVHPQRIASERDQKLKRLAGKFDRVLVDAPCSGIGTLRRNPDLKWRLTAQDLAELSAKQASILEAAARLVKPGGRLVYATCSLLREENEAVVDAFLAAHPQFHTIAASAVLAQHKVALDTGPTLKLLPHLHGTDGFFAAVLERS
ncbi:MAG: RsmB/NOP family class I SAM-dependent RNA methyltransferase [Methylophilaceae bacterium]|nr:RsmB/NOP family class I SAM-dependent RNA methyltransferase [Methylophilaceae bacterium]